MAETSSGEKIKQTLILNDEKVDTTDNTDLTVYGESDNDLIMLSFTNKGLNYNITPKFQEVLDESKRLAKESTELLDGATAETIDDDELSRIRSEMKPVREYRKNVDETQKDVRRVFNEMRDNFGAVIVNLLEDADFDVIERNEEKAKILNKDMLALRKKRNWDEVQHTFGQALEMYPDLPALYPNRLSFEAFANENEKLVSGAKNWKLNDDVVNTIKSYVTNVYTGHEVIKRLDSKFQDELIQRYDRTGDVKAALDLDEKYRKEEEAALERQKKIIEQEAARKAKEMARKQQLEEEAKRKAEAEEAKRIEDATKKSVEPINKSKNDDKSIASAPFGMEPPKKESISVKVADRVGFKKISKRMGEDDWTVSSLEAMDMLHRFLKGIYEQQPDIVELITSPDDVMKFVKEVADRTRQ